MAPASVLAAPPPPPADGRVPRLWPGSTIICLGGGPSLTQRDVDLCRGVAPVIAINDAYRLAPWADVLYGCDAQWWQWHQGVPGFAGRKFALRGMLPFDHFPDVCVLAHTGLTGIELDAGGLRSGKNSGYQAINLALHLGATRVVIVGYDMQATRGKPSHWFGEHPHQSRSPYADFVLAYDTLIEPLQVLGVTVVNASRVSALTCFPRVPLEEALAWVPPQ